MAIKLIGSGDFLFEGGRQTRSGAPPFEGLVSLSPEEQVQLAVILKRKGEKEYLRAGSVDFAFYFKENGSCNLVIRDYVDRRTSYFPLSPVEQEELRRMILVSLDGTDLSLYLEGNLIEKGHGEERVRVNGVLVPTEECWRLATALELGARYSFHTGSLSIEAGFSYEISKYVLSSESALKLQAVFESASLEFRPYFVGI
ncbi:hypothetical protein Theam_1744 (plasmid) [Thermovibrio ammonificans HB-1]|uniref:Uncharacterized protein n=1 Tax=Thermovibrio ammonificans (strain DSM 15698 / JCM 12110 / HB-1) TaxID=648996 RepID=E8T6X9_THEA1|nr:hypothetical protein [Thermovibrio ammonificans]ADU97700.1 hypothetical protein Theam_1744 [Thermovibrio ammonificans HB-1]